MDAPSIFRHLQRLRTRRRHLEPLVSIMIGLKLVKGIFIVSIVDFVRFTSYILSQKYICSEISQWR